LLAVFAKLAFWALVVCAVAAAVIWVPAFDWAAELPRFFAAMMIALAAAFAVGALLLVILAVGGVIGWGRALIGVGVIAGGSLAAALITVIVRAPIEMTPPPISFIAIIVLIAGGAGFALLSFGPTRSALFAIGARSGSQAPVGAADALDAQFARVGEIADAPASPTTRKAERAAEPLVARRIPEFPSAPDAPGARKRGGPALKQLYIVAAAGMALALFAVLAVSVRWTDPARQWTALWAKVQSEARPAQRAPMRAAPKRAPPSRVAPAPAEMFSIDPIADGRPGDVLWRRGYRARALRMDDGQAAQSLALPSTACGARVIVAFGSASSDGAPDANLRLARNRALWAAEWLRNQLAACAPAVAAPTIIAVSLGQGTGVADARQRQVRLIASRAGVGLPDLSDLRRQSTAIYPELESFVTFDSCIVLSADESAGSFVPCRRATRSPR
jgi:hypothetical protein